MIRRWKSLSQKSGSYDLASCYLLWLIDQARSFRSSSFSFICCTVLLSQIGCPVCTHGTNRHIFYGLRFEQASQWWPKASCLTTCRTFSVLAVMEERLMESVEFKRICAMHSKLITMLRLTSSPVQWKLNCYIMLLTGHSPASTPYKLYGWL